MMICGDGIGGGGQSKQQRLSTGDTVCSRNGEKMSTERIQKTTVEYVSKPNACVYTDVPTGGEGGSKEIYY